MGFGGSCFRREGEVRKTVVLNVVGLTQRLLDIGAPGLTAWASKGKTASIQAVTPAVTCSAQATYLTGTWPETHGIVANGWYFRDECEVKFWRQSNRLVQAPKIWEMAKAMDPSFTCANLFWWYNMHSSVEYAVTPRPMYPADGRKLPDCYTQPAELRQELQSLLGTFPLFSFWGPNTSIRSTQWIADAAKEVDKKYNPTLSLIYLPHMDYGLQRLGPGNPKIKEDLKQIDAVCTDLISYFESRNAQVLVLSEYGIVPVSRPIHINRLLREKGFIAVREELGRELLDAGASAAFAVSDHQIAHIYINDSLQIDQVKNLVEKLPGVERVLNGEGKKAFHMDHERAGELVAIAKPDAWFTYYYWLDERKAPDFARTVDIHRKPGYDPAELFIDPELQWPKVKVAMALAKKFLGFRYLMEVIPLDPALVKGSHGRITNSSDEGPLFITRQNNLLHQSEISAIDVCSLILDHMKN
jgi:predicted AlkP superfamily pyrophosphatase or phosphodiesterase